MIYPKGISYGEVKAFSFFLYSVDCVQPDSKIYAEFKMRVKDQCNFKHVEKAGICASIFFHLFCSCASFD